MCVGGSLSCPVSYAPRPAAHAPLGRGTLPERFPEREPPPFATRMRGSYARGHLGHAPFRLSTPLTAGYVISLITSRPPPPDSRPGHCFKPHPIHAPHPQLHCTVPGLQPHSHACALTWFPRLPSAWAQPAFSLKDLSNAPPSCKPRPRQGRASTFLYVLALRLQPCPFRYVICVVLCSWATRLPRALRLSLYPCSCFYLW